MALSDILQKILDSASAEVSAIEAEREEHKQKMSHQSMARMKIRAVEIEAHGAQVLSQIETKIEALARREISKSMQSSKQAVVQAAREAFYNHLIGLDDAAYGKIIALLFEPLKDKTATIIVPSNRLAITKKYAPKYCEIKSSDDIQGGFIFVFKGGEVNNSFHNLVFSQMKEDLTSFFAQSLHLIS